LLQPLDTIYWGLDFTVMREYIDIEAAAERLRQCLQIAPTPELQVLCGLRFFERYRDGGTVAIEANIREFVPAIVAAAKSSNPAEFLPQEVTLLAWFAELLADQKEGLVSRTDLGQLRALVDSAARALAGAAVAAPSPSQRDRGQVAITCLFVEHYPDLDLAPRGRILTLRVTASKLSSSSSEDAIIITNPVEKPNDRFLAQARDSVKAVRIYLSRTYGLSEKKRYRLDFAVDTTSARFTGDSLGLAFAIGAMAALSKVEVFRRDLSISTDVAFTGAISSEGELRPIDREALRLKIYRAFHSNLKCLVIPRAHMLEAWVYLRELEQATPHRRLELTGAADLGHVAEDPRLVPFQKLSAPTFAVRRAWRAKRSIWVEVPLLLVLLAILYSVVLHWLDRNPSSLRITGSTIEAVNRYDHPLWSKSFADCGSLDPNTSWAVVDLNGDGNNEILFAPNATKPSARSGWMFAYSSSGDSLFSCDCAVRFEYPNDTIPEGRPDLYFGPSIKVRRIKGELRIITVAQKNYPARSHIKMWDPTGRQLGWYVNSGGAGLHQLMDIDADGRDELIMAGFANRMKACCFFALPSDSFRGVSPPYAKNSNGYDLSWVKRGNQTAYVIFPPTDVCRHDMRQEYQGGAIATLLPGGGLGVQVMESPVDSGAATLDYYFSSRLRVSEVMMSDPYRKRRQTLINSGAIENIPEEKFLASLLGRVTYFIDTSWVTEAQLRTRGE
jgi:hypothetical protein